MIYKFILYPNKTENRRKGGVEIPGDKESWDFGVGAGFYIDATEEKWKKHYNMFSYVTQELVDLVEEHLPVEKNNRAISGHSMGGHGALICALKKPGFYKVSNKERDFMRAI